MNIEIVKKESNGDSMGFFSKLFGIVDTVNKNINNTNNNFNIDEYNNYNNMKIKEFTDRYDLSTKEGIVSIPISEATKYPDVNSLSVVYMPEQILSRKATEYKKEKNYDLAIECLKKHNELLNYSPFAYSRKDYERIVDMLVLAGRYDEARDEHERLDKKYGSRLMELKNLQKSVVSMGSESASSYEQRVILPYIQESKDKEQYYWMLENMPKIAPKSFGGYRTMKNKNSDNYLKIVDELKNVGKDIEELKFWK